MKLYDKSTNTDFKENSLKTSHGLTLKDGLSLIGSLLLPLMLGVFTVIVTLNQQQVASRQRLEDRKLAQEQREQDLNISREQRLQDLQRFLLQREQDLNISREQRQLDKHIAEEKRSQDNSIAEKQRNMLEQQRAHEMNIAHERLRDSLLVTYLNEIGLLLKENSGSLASNPVTATIARAKTLATIRQLDSTRNSFLVQFLYEAKQLTNGDDPLDLSDAELNDINFRGNAKYNKRYNNLSLRGVTLRNSSFIKCDLSYSDFSGTDVTDAEFNNSNLAYTDFSGSTLVRTKFVGNTLTHARFDNIHSRRTSFEGATASAASFFSSNLNQAVFKSCECTNTNFTEAKLNNADFSNAKLNNANFERTNLQKATFYFARAPKTTFNNGDMTSANFTKVSCERCTFRKTTLLEAQFYETGLRHTDFSFAKMRKINLTNTKLSLATLSYAQLDDAIFNMADVTLVNFSFTTMSKKTEITNEQLLSSASIRSARLPNGSVFTSDPNLLRNGKAICNNSQSVNDWNVKPSGAIIISTMNNKSSDCVFSSITNDLSTMIQKVNLTKYHLLTAIGRGVVLISMYGSDNLTSIQIKNYKGQELAKQTIPQGTNFVTMRTQVYSYEIEIVVQLIGYSWCNNLTLTYEALPQTP